MNRPAASFPAWGSVATQDLGAVGAAACEVHHTTHLADGGITSVRTCGLYCFFHHHIAIHKWGWTVTLNPDGTTTARSPDGTKVLRSHGPPSRE